MSGNGRDLGRRGLLGLAVCGLLAGLGAYGAGQEGLARGLWAAGVVPVLAGLVVEIVLSLRRGEVGLDVVAALSMSAALIFGEPLAAAVVAVMYAGGAFLESYAEGRARVVGEIWRRCKSARWVTRVCSAEEVIVVSLNGIYFIQRN